MIKRIRIKGYKSFQDFNLELKPLSVIFGPNASGKSNLLDAIYLISRVATCKNLKEAFEGHRGLPLESFYYGDKGYDQLLKKKQIALSFEVDVKISDAVIDKMSKIIREKRRGIESSHSGKKLITERFLRYHISIEALPHTGYLRVIDEKLTALRKNGKEKKRSPFIERMANRIHLRMEGQAHPTYHEVGLDHTIVSTALYEPHYPHIAAFRAELANWQVYYLEPKALMREEVPLAKVENIGPRGENLAAFVNTLRYANEKAYRNFNLTLNRILPTESHVEVEHLTEGRLSLRLYENGIPYSARLISEGTLRLIGLLAAIHPTNPGTMIGYEEPENGVHPVRLKIIADLLKGTVLNYAKQIIVTTHSPIFPGYFGDSDLFVCRKENGQSVINPFRTFGPLFKRRDIDRALEDRILRGDFGG